MKYAPMRPPSDNSLGEILKKLNRGEKIDSEETYYLLRTCFYPAIKRFLRSAGKSPSDPDIVQDLVAHLWAFSCRATSTGNLWQKALQTIPYEEPADSDKNKVVCRYLQQAFEREIRNHLFKDSPLRAVKKILRKGLKRADLQVTGSGSSQSDILVALDGGAAPPPRDFEQNIEAYLEEIAVPPARGTRSNRAGVPLPTPAQAATLIEKVLKKHRCSLRFEQCLKLLFKAFKIPLQEANVSLDSEAEDSGSDDARGDRPTSSELIGPLAQLPVRKDPYAPARQAVDEILEMIEAADKAPSERPQSGREGRLGRLLVEFALWQGWRLKDSEQDRYGLQRYADRCGSTVQTEHDRLKKKLQPLMQKVFKKYDLAREEGYLVMNHLRAKFYHRKPENVSGASFSERSEESNLP